MPIKPVSGPTENQLDVLRFIIAYVEDHGFQPSYREIAVSFGITKPAIVARLKELERHGVIVMSAMNRQRAINLKFVRFKACFVDQSHH